MKTLWIAKVDGSDVYSSGSRHAAVSVLVGIVEEIAADAYDWDVMHALQRVAEDLRSWVSVGGGFRASVDGCVFEIERLTTI